MGVVTSAISNIIMARPVAAPSLPNVSFFICKQVRSGVLVCFEYFMCVVLDTSM